MFFKHLLSNPYNADEQMLSSFVQMSDVKLVVFERQKEKRWGESFREHDSVLKSKDPA